MLGLQLTLTWLQGSLLHRQHKDLLALREDVQVLTDSMEQGMSGEDFPADGLAPARQATALSPRIQRVGRVQSASTEVEQAQKDLLDAKASALQAVSEARAVRSKLSIEENLRRAEEKVKVDAAENAWQKWLWLALGVGMLAVAIRAWLRRRG